MKVTNKIDKKMVAICGTDCMVCYKHLITKKYSKQCNGCKYVMKHCLSIVESVK